MVAETATTNRIDVRQAAKIALDFVQEMYRDEKIANVGLEELDYDESIWLITVGFTRPWQRTKRTRKSGPVTDFQSPRERQRLAALPPNRDYKLIRIDGDSGKVLDMKMREF